LQPKINLQSFESTPDSLKQRLKAFERKLSLGVPDGSLPNLTPRQFKLGHQGSFRLELTPYVTLSWTFMNKYVRVRELIFLFSRDVSLGRLHVQ